MCVGTAIRASARRSTGHSGPPMAVSPRLRPERCPPPSTRLAVRAGIRHGFVVALALAVAACAQAGGTFEDGVERQPGPASFVVRIDPPAAADTSRIEFTAYDDEPTPTFPARRGLERYITGTTLPSTLRARVDGAACQGSIDLLEDLEADATLTKTADGCTLRLDLLHRPGSIDHRLEDVP